MKETEGGEEEDLAELRGGLEKLPAELQLFVARLLVAAESTSSSSSSIFRLRIDMEVQPAISVLEVNLQSDLFSSSSSASSSSSYEDVHLFVSFFHLLTSLRLVDLVIFNLPSSSYSSSCSFFRFEDILPFLLSCASSSTPFRISHPPPPSSSSVDNLSSSWGVGSHWPGSSRTRFLTDPDLSMDMHLCTSSDCRDGWTCNFHLHSSTLPPPSAASH